MGDQQCRIRVKGAFVEIGVHGVDDAATEAAQLQLAVQNKLAVEVVVFLYAMPASRHWMRLLRVFEYAKLRRVVVQGHVVPKFPAPALPRETPMYIETVVAGVLHPSALAYLGSVGLLSASEKGRLWIKQNHPSPDGWTAFPAIESQGLVVILEYEPTAECLSELAAFLKRTFQGELDVAEIVDCPSGHDSEFGKMYLVLRPKADGALTIGLLGSALESADRNRYEFDTVDNLMAKLYELLEPEDE